MKKKYKVLLLFVITLLCVSFAFSQTAGEREQLTVEQLEELIRIQKAEIREAAKVFLVDELPILSRLDPERALGELERFQGLLNTMSDSEVMYLLGHMYARENENDRAILMFDSVLRENLNPDARQMLNLVMYRKLITFLDAGNRDAARDLLRTIIFDNYNSSPYFPAYLYIYTDLQADSANYQEVIQLIGAYNENRDIVLNRILPAKQSLLARLNALNIGAFYQEPNQKNYDTINAEINELISGVTILNDEILSLRGMVYVDELQKIHAEEIQNLYELKQLLLDYANAPVKTEEVLVPARGHLQATRATIVLYDSVLRKFDLYLDKHYQELTKNEQESEYKQNMTGFYLDKIIQADNTIFSYKASIEEINEMLDSGKYRQHQAELIGRRDEATRNLADLELRRAQYLAQIDFADDHEREIFLELVDDYNGLLSDKHELQITLDELEDFIFVEMRNIMDAGARGLIRPRVSEILSDTSDVPGRHGVFSEGLAENLNNVEFYTLQIEYNSLMKEYGTFTKVQASLPADELEQMQGEFKSNQQRLIQNINSFLRANPNFKSMDQPGGGKLAQAADLYYKLGELQYYSNPQDMSPALASYKRAIQLDPQLPDKDLALYNIAFITSEMAREEIEANRIAFNISARVDDRRPPNARYSEANFRETLNALEEIAQNYPDSKVYEESVYRLGLLNFSFSEDAEFPGDYRNRAIAYFDIIIENEDSPFYYDALYQRGWVRLNKFQEDDLRDAVDDFLAILRAIDDGKITDPNLKRDYGHDAANNIGYILSAMDGTQWDQSARGVQEVQRIYNSYHNQEVVDQMIQLAAKNKYSMGAMLQSADFLRHRVDSKPLALENPSLLDSMLVLYANSTHQLRPGENFDQIRRSIYQELVNGYNQDSQWYAQNKNKEIQPQLEIVDKAFEQYGIILYNTFATNINRSNLQNYVAHTDKYHLFVKTLDPANEQFRANADSVYANFYAVLAENADDMENYLEAITYLRKYNDKYAPYENCFLNEQRSLVFSQRVYDQSMESFKQPGFTPLPGQPATPAAAFEYLNVATQRYLNVVKREEYATPENLGIASGLLMNLSIIKREEGDLDAAISHLNRALEFEGQLSNTQQREIYLALAGMSYENKNYLESESWYRKALPLAANEAQRRDIENDILVQIQSIFEGASESGDYIKEAEERLRFASQLNPNTQANEVLGQKYAAVQAYVNARSYQNAIDLLMEISENETDALRVYTWYMEAAEIAQSKDKMNNPALAVSIEKAFIEKLPASNYAFILRLEHLGNSFADPALAQETATGYLALYEDVLARKTDPGTVSPQMILQDAILAYVKTPDRAKEYELRYRFISQYPNHENVIPYMEYMAAGHYERGEMEDYERLAEAIFKKDPSRNNLYQHVAESTLLKIGKKAEYAYLNKDYDAVLGFRDEYNRTEAAYIREGLRFQNQDAHDFFAAVKKEHDDLKRFQAYLISYDKQLDDLSKSELFTKSAANHIRVNSATTWDGHLGAGHKRIDYFQKAVSAEINKTLKLIQQANESGFDIDNDRRIAAIELLAKINERGRNVLEQQIESYFSTTNEAAYYRNNYSPEQLQAEIANVIAIFSDQYYYDMLRWQHTIYRFYHLPGYHNAQTQAAIASLEAKGITLEYSSGDYILDSSWRQELLGAPAQLSISTVKSPAGTNMGRLSIPADNTLILKKNFSLSLTPDFAYLNVAYPPVDAQIKLNGSLVQPDVVPIDTLVAGRPITTRYVMIIPQESFVEGANELEVEFTNASSQSLDLALSLQLKTDLARIRANIPPIVSTIHTNSSWRVFYTDPESGDENQGYAIPASNWGISWDDIDGFSPTAASPIWLDETEHRYQRLVFETDFVLESEFKEGRIDFVAPDNVTIYLNGNLLSNSLMDYDPDPFAIYALPILLPANYTQMGKNTLRFEVSNASEYRGFLSTITISRAGKEEIR